MGRSINGIRSGGGGSSIVAEDPIIATTHDEKEYDLSLKIDGSTIVVNNQTGELNAIVAAQSLVATLPIQYPGNDPAGPRLTFRYGTGLTTNGTTNALQVNAGDFIDHLTLDKIPDDVPIGGGCITVYPRLLTDLTTCGAPLPIRYGQGWLPGRISVWPAALIDTSDPVYSACLISHNTSLPAEQQRLRVDTDAVAQILGPANNVGSVLALSDQPGGAGKWRLAVDGARLIGASLLWDATQRRITVAVDAKSILIDTNNNGKLTVNVDNKTIASDATNGQLKTKVVYGTGLKLTDVADAGQSTTHPLAEVDFTTVASKTSVTAVQQQADATDTALASTNAVVAGHTSTLGAHSALLAGIGTGGTTVATLLAGKQDLHANLTALSATLPQLPSLVLQNSSQTSGSSVDMLTMKFDGSWGIRMRQNYAQAGDIHYDWLNNFSNVERLFMSIRNDTLTLASPIVNVLNTLTVNGGAGSQPTMMTLASAATARNAHAVFLSTNGSNTTTWGLYHGGVDGSGALTSGELGWYSYTSSAYILRVSPTSITASVPINVPTPTSANHAVPKSYVDAITGGTAQPANANLTNLSASPPTLNIASGTFTLNDATTTVGKDLMTIAQSGLSTNAVAAFNVGKAQTSNNAATFLFNNIGGAGSALNRAEISLYASAARFTVNGNGAVTIPGGVLTDTTGTFGFVDSTSVGDKDMLSVLIPNTQTGRVVAHNIGQAQSAYNSTSVVFRKVGATGSVNNTAEVGLYARPALAIDGAGNTTIPGNLNVRGNILSFNTSDNALLTVDAAGSAAFGLLKQGGQGTKIVAASGQSIKFGISNQTSLLTNISSSTIQDVFTLSNTGLSTSLPITAADPVVAQNVATKAYVDQVISGTGSTGFQPHNDNLDSLSLLPPSVSLDPDDDYPFSIVSPSPTNMQYTTTSRTLLQLLGLYIEAGNYLNSRMAVDLIAPYGGAIMRYHYVPVAGGRTPTANSTFELGLMQANKWLTIDGNGNVVVPGTLTTPTASFQTNIVNLMSTYGGNRAQLQLSDPNNGSAFITADAHHAIYLRSSRDASIAATVAQYSYGNFEFWNGGLIGAQTKKLDIGTTIITAYVPITVPTPTASGHVATKGYVDTVAVHYPRFQDVKCTSTGVQRDATYVYCNFAFTVPTGYSITNFNVTLHVFNNSNAGSAVDFFLDNTSSSLDSVIYHGNSGTNMSINWRQGQSMTAAAHTLIVRMNTSQWDVNNDSTHYLTCRYE